MMIIAGIIVMNGIMGPPWVAGMMIFIIAGIIGDEWDD